MDKFDKLKENLKTRLNFVSGERCAADSVGLFGASTSEWNRLTQEIDSIRDQLELIEALEEKFKTLEKQCRGD